MELALIIVAIVQVIVLIGFFQVTGDVRAIRNELIKNSDRLLSSYNKSVYFDREDEALYNLQEYIWMRLRKSSSKRNYDKLKEEWTPAFEALNSEFPEYAN